MGPTVSPIRKRINTCELAWRATYSFVSICVVGLLTEIRASLSPVVKVMKTRTNMFFVCTRRGHRREGCGLRDASRLNSRCLCAVNAISVCILLRALRFSRNLRGGRHHVLYLWVLGWTESESGSGKRNHGLGQLNGHALLRRS